MKTIQENPNGLHQKYVIKKIKIVDTKPLIINDVDYSKRQPKQKVELVDVDKDSEYFVLRLDLGGSDINHIKACRIGIHAYADAIESTIPQLAKDIHERYPLL